MNSLGAPVYVDQIWFSDGTGLRVQVDVVIEDQPRFRYRVWDRSNYTELRLSVEASRVLQGAIGRLLEGR